MKPTDLHFVKLYLTEIDLLNYAEEDVLRVDQLMRAFYQSHLKRNATRSFLTWADKQVKEVLKPQIAGVQTVIDQLYEQLEEEGGAMAEYELAKKRQEERQMQNRLEVLKTVKNEAKKGVPVQAEEPEKDLDRFITEKKVRLMSKDNNEMADPLMQVYQLLAMQELDLLTRSVNQIPVRGRGRVKRGGKKTKRKREKERAKSGEKGKKKEGIMEFLMPRKK